MDSVAPSDGVRELGSQIEGTGAASNGFHHTRATHIHKSTCIAGTNKIADRPKIVTQCVIAIWIARTVAKQHSIWMQVDAKHIEIGEDQPLGSPRQSTNSWSPRFCSTICAPIKNQLTILDNNCMAARQRADVHRRELGVPRTGDDTGETSIAPTPSCLNQANGFTFRPPLPARRRRSISDAGGRIRPTRDFHASHDRPKRAPNPKGLVRDSPAMLFFESGPPSGHLIECNRVRIYVAPHVSNPMPSGPPNFNSSRQGAS